MAIAAGLTPGTPAYMAPEMVMGETVDGRADLYALGCVAYFLLTGQLVFEATSGLQVIAKHMQEIPVPPSERTELEVDPTLNRLVLSCLAKKPEDRPQSAAEADRELGDIQTQPWGQEEAQWQRSHPASTPSTRPRAGARSPPRSCSGPCSSRYSTPSGASGSSWSS